MSHRELAWPGLGAGGGRHLLEVRRAAYGKVHRARSDYRWLAATPGWSPAAEQRERALRLGHDDVSMTCPFWRQEATLAIAGYCKPSRAVDASNRQTPIEKHVLLWARAAGDPAPAQAAPALLDAAAGLDDTPWFDSHGDAEWLDSTYVRPLSSSFEPRVELRADDDEAAIWIASGVTLLRGAVTLEDLSGFYAALSAGHAPAVLPLTTDTALNGRALAVLLLPLPSTRTIAIAGGIPSSIFPSPEDVRQWDGLCAQRPLRPPRDARVPSDRHIEIGERTAAAIWHNEPSRLAARPSSLVLRPEPARADPPARDSIRPQTPGVVPRADPLAATILLARRAAAERAFVAFVESETRFVLPLENQLVPTDDDAAARTLAERFRDRFVRGPLADAQADAARTTPGAYHRSIAEARVYQLRIKADLCRAWLLAIAPRPDVVAVAGEFDSQEIEPLLLASMVSPREWRRCSRLDSQTVRKLEDVSLSVGVSDDIKKRIRQWTAAVIAER